MDSKERNLIKSVSNKTGVGVSMTTKCLNDFKEIGILPDRIQLFEYIKLKNQPITRYKVNKDGEKVPWETYDYIIASMKV